MYAAAVVVFPLMAAGLEENVVAKSTVAVDRRSGRLVRRIMVPENIVESRVIASRPVGSLQPGARLPGAGTGPVSAIVDEVAGQHQVDPLLVHSIIHVESNYNRFALSPKGAEGLMQLIPSTARRMGVRNSFDSRQNIEGGVRYLRQLLDRFADLRHVLAAYNAGENAVERWGGIPPYTETQDYVFRVGRRYGELRRAQKQMDVAKVAAVAVAAPAQPEFRPLESYVDAEGRLNLRTR